MKMKIKILTDTAADFTLAEYKENGVEFIPLIVSFGDIEFYDNVNITADQFYEKLTKNKLSPKSAQITPYRWQEKFEELTSDGSQLLVITLSSKLSNTYQSACQAAATIKNVYVVDGLSATIGQKLLVKLAIKLVNDGKEITEIVDILNEKKKDVRIFALVDTLEYLKRGGRISSAAAIAGNIINLKPIISVIDGEVKMVSKAIGNRRGNKAIMDLVANTNGIDFDLPWGTVYAGSMENLDKFISDCSLLFEGNEIEEVCQIGPTIGTHVGPGAFGISYFEKK